MPENPVDKFNRLFTAKVSKHISMLARCFDQKNPDDLYQDAILAAYENIGQFVGDDSGFIKWISQIIRFKHFSNSRFNRMRHGKFEKIQRVQARNLECRIPSDDELSDEMTRAMRRIRKDERYLFYMVYVLDYKYSEMAEMLGIPVGSIMSRLHRIKGKLRLEIETVSPRADSLDSHSYKTST